jgi:hypothetical protein
MSAVIRPITRGRDPLTGGNHGGVANDGDEIAVTSRLHPDDAKTVLGVLVGDALNQPGQHLPVGWLWFRLHDVYRRGVVGKMLGRGPKVGRNLAVHSSYRTKSTAIGGSIGHLTADR